MKKLNNMLICFLLTLIMVFAGSCSSESILGTNADNEVELTINVDGTGRGWNVVRYNVTATSNKNVVKNASSTDNSLSIKLTKDIWSFVVTAEDSQGTQLFKGSKANVDLTTGTIANLTVFIIKMSGELKVDLSAALADYSGISNVSVEVFRPTFETQTQTLAAGATEVSFLGLAQGLWTITAKGTVNGAEKSLGSKTGNVIASNQVKVTFESTVTTTTSSTTTSTTTTIPPTTTTTVVLGDETDYYWTNKAGHYGSNKTISGWSDWTEAEKIAQCSGYDDPRTWRGIQETPYDVYALYAAYDDNNLYLMVELVNLADERATFMNHNYAGSDNANWDNRDCPLGFIINTGKGKTATSPLIGSASGKPIWDAIKFSDANGFDFLFYGSSKYGYAEHNSKFVGVGTPGLFKINSSTGYFSYDKEYCLSVNSNNSASSNGTAGTSGMTIRYKRQCAVSQTIYFESTPTDNRTTSGQTGADLLASTTFKSCSTNNLDMSYWYTIPLSTLGITKSYIQSNGIGVRQLTPNGGSLMDCCPWDASMVNNATEPCSDDESTSNEKEDADAITSRQARVGK